MSLDRAELQNAVQGWKPRLKDAESKLASAEQECTTLQDEFTVAQILEKSVRAELINFTGLER